MVDDAIRSRVDLMRRAEQPRTPAGKELLQYLGIDMDADYIRRTIVKIEREAANNRSEPEASS